MSGRRLCLVLGLVAVPALAHAQSLDETLALAELTNPRIEVGRAEAALAEEALEEARAQGRTRVTIGASAGYESVDTNRAFAFNAGDRPVGSANIEAALPIYTGGRVAAGIRAAKAGIDAADQSLESLRQQTYLQAVRAYMNVRSDRDALAIRQNNVELLREQVRAANARFDVGVVTRTDVALAEARLASSLAGEAAARAQLEASEADFQAVTGVAPGDLPPPPPIPNLPDSLEAALAIALETNPGLEAAREQVRAANEQIEAAEAEGRPTLEIVGSAGGQQDWDQDIYDTEVRALARGSIPLWQGGLVNSRVRSARLRRDRAQSEVDAAERDVRAAIASAWYGYIAADRSIEASRRQVEAAEIAYEGATQELGVGTRTTLDVLDSEQDLLDARLSLVTAERDAQIAAHQLLQAMGLLTLARLYPDMPADEVR